MDSGQSNQATDPWGRVAQDGTVYVRSGADERNVGQWPDGDPTEALAFFKKRYDALEAEVGLLEQRLSAGKLSPEDATASVKKLRVAIPDAQAVGDLGGLLSRLDLLTVKIAEHREHRKIERAKKLEDATEAKERIVVDATRLSESSDWRNGANRLRELLEEWKALPRLDKGADDALWRRFSAARTTYSRHRKAHFTLVHDQRDTAREAMERLVAEAEKLAESQDWGPTAGKYRDLMRQWKSAGSASKGVDDQLWARFRAAQDRFFGARDSSNAELDREFAGNAEKKEALLTEAEALLPVTDLRVAKEKFRDLADRWDAAGKVPRERMKELEGRMRKVEQAIRGLEDDQWTRSNPEARARAADTVAKLEASLEDLAKKQGEAIEVGNTKKAEEHAAAIDARKSWLAQAQRALREFSG